MNIDNYIEKLNEDERFEYVKGISLTLLNNKIILFQECNCFGDDIDTRDPECEYCSGKGYYLTETGKELYNFIKAIPAIEKVLNL